MNILMIFPYYIYWHYTHGIKSLFSLSKNILVFLFHYFSVKELIQNLLAPYQRLKERYDKNSFDIENLLSIIIINLIMRIIGLIIRLVILTIAFVCIVFFTLLIPVVFVVWLILPFALIFMMILSIMGFINI